MDDWTYSYADVDSPSTQVAQLDQEGHASEGWRDLAQQTEAARWAADLEETEARDEALTISEIPLSAATPSGLAISC
jgi:hypothetical protein